MRRILIYALSAFIAAFLWVLVHTPAAYAADAKWNGSTIVYETKPFSSATADGKRPPDLDKGTTYYLFSEGDGKAKIIYFPSGSANSATSATFREYTIDRDGAYGKKVTDKKITITAKSASSSSKNAAWSGNNLDFNGKTYLGNGTGPYIADSESKPTLPVGSQYYLLEGVPNAGGEATIGALYFPPGVTPTSETGVSYVTFTFSNGTSWSSPSSVQKITVTPKGSADDPAATEASVEATTCDIDGIGWIVCPVSNFLAKGMDDIFDMLRGFLEVKPLSTDSSLYAAWSYMRTFANVAFVISFLIIIYSQLTNVGITNYSIKKLLPRLIIAAVLVNVSYFICAIAVDLSNILGSSLQDIFKILRDNLVSSNTNNVSSWQSVTGFILAGGTAAAATAAGISVAVVTSGASVGAALILLLPILLSLILAILVALVVLAARQAVIVLLIIVAPLAFVAYLLPNTEKWFEKWRSIFFTLLIFFPIFALIFGGSQLAGFLIRDNTDQINIILLGMFVQIAPLVLTPLLIKFSGSLVGRIAGLVNNPSKGILDRTKNWAKGQSDYLAARNMARTDPMRRRQVFRRFASGMDQQHRAREARKNMYTTQSDAKWTNSSEFGDIDQGVRLAQDQKSLGESTSEARYAQSKNVAGAVQSLEIELKKVKLDIEVANAKSEIHWEGSKEPVVVEGRLNLRGANETLGRIKSQNEAEWEDVKSGRIGSYSSVSNIARIARQAHDDTDQITINSMRTSAAKRTQLREIGQSLSANQSLLREAAGIDNINGKGEISILANVKSQIEAEKDTLVKNIKIASDIKPGDVTGLTVQFEKAVRQGNTEAMRAYTDLLVESANPGVVALRKVIDKTESIMPADAMSELKAHINSSGPINSAAEDIASWSRDEKSRRLHDIAADKTTWVGLTAAGFAGMKKSSQEAALLTGGISRETARDILSGPVKQNLKPDMVTRMEKLAKGQSYTDGINNPFA